MYIAREREREIHRRLWIVGRTWPTNIPSISFPARERGQTRRDRDNETSPPSSLFPTRYLLVQRDSWPFSTRSRKERNFCLYVYIYIYIFPRGGSRVEGGVIPVSSISSFIRWVYVRIWDTRVVSRRRRNIY